jgi:branched-chain amino acid aminotransferase
MTSVPKTQQTRIAYFNGKFVPEREALLPFREQSVKNGASAYDTTRTFHGRPFRLDDHIERLYRSMRYIELDPGISPRQMTELTEQVVEANAAMLRPGEDWWVNHRVTYGIDAVGDEGWGYEGPSVIIDCRPLPLRQRAEHYRNGIDLVVSPVRRTPPWALNPRAKIGNKLNHLVADLAVAKLAPGAWSLMLDENGNIAEGKGSNFFLVRRGEVLTPGESHVLPGISRQVVMELARKLGLPMFEADIDLFEAKNSDEAFMTATSFCICPVRSIDGLRIGKDTPAGPVTKRLTAEYIKLAGLDFVKQSYAAESGSVPAST